MSIDASIELVNKMAFMQQAISDSIDEGLEKAGKLIVQLASELAPKDSGDLSESGDSFVRNKVLYVSFGNGLPDDRARAQEFGTIYMPAQPYLIPAVKNIDVTEEVAKVLRTRLS